MMHETNKSQDNETSDAALIESCRAVIRIPSESGNEQKVAELFAETMRRLAYDEVEVDGLGNVVGIIRGQGNGPNVMINGHIDHVPVGDMVDPFSAEIVDAARWGESGLAIYGRGTCDMKSNIMAGVYAAARMRGRPLRGDIIVVADVKEEIDSPEGVKSVIQRGITADYGISAESTDLGVYLGHRGKLEFDVTVVGRTAHSSEPDRGLNAIFPATAFVDAIRRYAHTLPHDDLMGAATVAITHIASSPWANTPIIPDRCLVRIDRRYIRSETPDDVEAEVRAVAEGVQREHPDYRIEFSRFNHYPLMFTDPASPIVQAALAARAAVLGERVEPGAWRFGVNGTFMVEAGIPTVGVGPGNEKWAHTPDEHVSIDQLKQVVRIYEDLLQRVCGHSPV